MCRMRCFACRLIFRYKLLVHTKKRLSLFEGVLTEISELRKQYIDALREADRGDYTALISFVGNT